MCFELIKIIELEISGIRDGDGYWHGSDVIGGLEADLCRAIGHLKYPRPALPVLGDAFPF